MVDFKVLLDIQVRNRTQQATQAAQSIRGVSNAINEMDHAISLWTQKRAGQELMKFGSMASSGMIEAMNSAAALESKMMGLSFFMEEDMTSDAFVKFQKGLYDIATNLGLPKDKLIEFAQEAAQGGVEGRDGILKVSDAVARFAKTSGISMENLMESMVKLNTQFGGTADSMQGLADDLFNVSRVMPATTEFIRDASLNVAAFAKASGLARIQVIAMLGGIATATKTAGKSGNVLNRLLRSLLDPGNAGKVQQQLGLTKEEAENTFLVIDSLMNKISDNNGEASKLSDVLVLFDKLKIEAAHDAAALKSLADQWDEVRGAMDRFGQSSDGIISSYLEEKLKSYSEQLSRLSESLKALKEEMGFGFLPVGRVVLQHLNDFLLWIRSFSPETKKLIGGFLLFGGALTFALGTIIAAVAGYKLLHISVIQVIQTLTGGIATFGFLHKEFNTLPKAIGAVSSIFTGSFKNAIMSFTLSLIRLGRVFVSKKHMIRGLKNIALLAIDGIEKVVFGVVRAWTFMKGLTGASILTGLKGILSSFTLIGRAVLAAFAPLAIAIAAIVVIKGLMKALGIDFEDVLGWITTGVEFVVDAVSTVIGTAINLVIEFINLVIRGWNTIAGFFGLSEDKQLSEIEFRSESGYFNKGGVESHNNNFDKGHVNHLQAHTINPNPTIDSFMPDLGDPYGPMAGGYKESTLAVNVNSTIKNEDGERVGRTKTTKYVRKPFVPSGVGLPAGAR